MEDFWVIGIAIFQFVCGWIAAEIAGRKDRSFGGFFLLGFLLGLLGIAIAAIVSGTPAPSARTKTAAPATRPFTCPRCNARQNVELGRSQYECWQCSATLSIRAKAVEKATGKREDWREWLGKS